jgi:hypothetical protein
MKQGIWPNMTVFWDVTPCSLVEAYRRFALMMVTVSFSETSVNFYQTTRGNIPEVDLHTHRRENLGSPK